jgi:type IV pilus assembly protein PilB
MDPDIVFVGEIRDPEAANIAMRAASSGRFVFSSLHTRDVASTITVLRDLGASDFSLSSNLVGLLNQRLVRRLCLKCRKAAAPSQACLELLAEYGIEAPAEVNEATGCAACRGSGFAGRCGVFEIVDCDEELSAAIGESSSESEIRRLIRARGTPSLTYDALTKVVAGITSFQEAVSVRWL